MNRTMEEERHLEGALYVEWKRHGRHLKEYGAELIETLFSVFCVVGIVSLFFAAGSPLPRLLPSAALRLLLVGLALGGVGWLIALSPPGRLSGAHTNPAVSLGFALLGKMHTRDLGGYWVGQILGAGLGAWLGVGTFGRLAQQARDGSLRPGHRVGAGAALCGEAAATFALTFVIFTFVSHKKLARWTPAVAMLMVGILVWADGNYSGAGMNPARWFGPALALWDWRLWWVYVFGPMLGTLLAILLRRTGLFFPAVPHTGKLLHDHRYRSIFRHDTLPSAPPVIKTTSLGDLQR